MLPPSVDSQSNWAANWLVGLPEGGGTIGFGNTSFNLVGDTIFPPVEMAHVPVQDTGAVGVYGTSASAVEMQNSQEYLPFQTNTQPFLHAMNEGENFYYAVNIGNNVSNDLGNNGNENNDLGNDGHYNNNVSGDNGSGAGNATNTRRCSETAPGSSVGPSPITNSSTSATANSVKFANSGEGTSGATESSGAAAATVAPSVADTAVDSLSSKVSSLSLELEEEAKSQLGEIGSDTVDFVAKGKGIF